MTTIISPNYIMSEYKYCQLQKKTDEICISWIHHSKKMGMFSMVGIVKQINDWKETGLDMRINDANTNSFEFQGKTWFVMVVQEYKDGEIYQVNPLCPMSLFLFGEAVNGYTYAFETATERDTIIPFIKNMNEAGMIEIEKVDIDTTGITEFKPFPMLGNYNPSKEVLKQLCEIRSNIEKCFKNVENDYGKRIAGDIQYFEISHTLTEANPKLRELRLQYNDCNYEFGEIKEDIFGVCMLYAQKQFIKNKEFVVILNDTLETMKLLSAQDLRDYIHKRVSIVKDLRIEYKAVQLKLEEELAAIPPLVEERIEVNTKAELKKETTRKANKAKNQKEKERLEYEARVAEANRILEEQERKKKMLKAKKQVAKR